MRATALIAEDEPLPAAKLARELQRSWPELEIVDSVRNGIAAAEQTIKLQPDIVFLDVQMPGRTGLDVAGALAKDWGSGSSLPLLVFVTAYEQYAVEAFEHAAIDYLLKPVERERLDRTCKRLKSALESRQTAPSSLSPELEMLTKLRHLMGDIPQSRASAGLAQRLERIQVSDGSLVHMVPIEDVIYFEAADKYVRVITAEREHLVRRTLVDLLARLDPKEFWQVHRGTVVRASAIVTAERQESGNFVLTLRGQKQKLVATRQYAHLFRSM